MSIVSRRSTVAMSYFGHVYISSNVYECLITRVVDSFVEHVAQCPRVRYQES